LAESKAKMYLVTNLVSTRNETHNYTPEDFVALVKEYTNKRLDGLVVPAMSRKKFETEYKDVAKLYDLEHSYFLGWEEKELERIEKNGVKIVLHNATEIVEGKNNFRVVRHNIEKLSDALLTILPK
jgi:hypothetical protein